jgi:hypothetical protein
VGAHAADKVTRLVVGPGSLQPQVQRDDLTAFAERIGLIYDPTQATQADHDHHE